MPIKTGDSLQDPVGAIARGIVKCDTHGHASPRDFVLVGVRMLDIDRDRFGDERIDGIAAELHEDMGERWATAPQMAAMIYARLTAS